MSEKQEKKALDKFVYEFEEKVKYKQKADSNITFEAFTKQYLENYAELQLAPKTIERYKSLFRRINIAIGHIKLEKLQIGHLADLYSQLGESKNQQGTYFIATEEFMEYSATFDEEQSKIIFTFLKNKDVNGCLEYIETLINSVDDEEQFDKLEKLYKYFYENRNGLISYKDRGLNISKAPESLEYRTLGTMEHNIDGIIAQRMKGRRANWSIKGATNLSKLLCAKESKKLTQIINEISKKVLPKSQTDDIITILSASKAPKTDGKGYDGKVCPRPFSKASITNGRQAIDRMFNFKPVSELSFK